MRFIHTPIFSIFNDHIIDYPTSINTSYASSFGFLAGVCLSIQIITGVLLSMHYTPEMNAAFNSVQHIMRDVHNGWLIRHTHANGASIFFLMVYAHIFRNTGSDDYPGGIVAYIGMLIFILMMATAFTGYILPWGQMSFWGATVITNLFAAIPIIGESISQWLWGGFAVSQPTLNRFFSLHYLLPFIIVALVILHLVFLHSTGSHHDDDIDTIAFWPYFFLKDLVALCWMVLLFIILVFFMPNFLGHPDNYIPADPLSTPTHLVPEWYFLPFYAVLRSTPDKLGGLLLMSIATFWLFEPSDTEEQYDLYVFMVLGVLGSRPAEAPYIEMTQIVSTIPILDYFFVNDSADEDNSANGGEVSPKVMSPDEFTVRKLNSWLHDLRNYIRKWCNYLIDLWLRKF